MPISAWIAAIALWVCWWSWFVASELWLRRRREPVEWSARSSRTALAIVIPAVVAAWGIATDSVLAYVLFTVCVVAPYVGVTTAMIRNR